MYSQIVLMHVIIFFFLCFVYFYFIFVKRFGMQLLKGAIKIKSIIIVIQIKH